MRLPTTTGRAARLLGRREPSLNDLIRRGKVTNPPPAIAGRRLWTLDDILRAADDLGVDRAAVEQQLHAIEDA